MLFGLVILALLGGPWRDPRRRAVRARAWVLLAGVVFGLHSVLSHRPALGYLASADRRAGDREHDQPAARVCRRPVAAATRCCRRFVQTIAPFVPQYHVGRLALIAVGLVPESGRPTRRGPLALFTVLGVICAALAYRRHRESFRLGVTVAVRRVTMPAMKMTVNERKQRARAGLDAVRVARLPGRSSVATPAIDHGRGGGLDDRRGRGVPAALLRGLPLAGHAAAGHRLGHPRASASPWSRVNPAGSCFFIYAAAFLGFTGPPRSAFGWLALMLAVVVRRGVSARHADPGAGCRRWWLPRLSAAPTSSSRRCIARTPLARRAAGRRGNGAHRRARADRPRPARSAGPHAVGDRAEVGAGLQARGSRSRARAVRRFATSSASRARRSPRCARRCAATDPRDSSTRSPTPSACWWPPASRAEIAVVRQTLPPEEDRALAYALREAVTNVVRHAGATRCWIRLAGRRRAHAPRSARQRPRRAGAGRQRPVGHARAAAAGRRHARTGRPDRHPPGDVAARPRDRVMIRVLLAEDQAMVLGALSALLDIESDLEVVAAARIGDRGARAGDDPRGPTSWSPTSRCQACRGSSWPPN